MFIMGNHINYLRGGCLGEFKIEAYSPLLIGGDITASEWLAREKILDGFITWVYPNGAKWSHGLVGALLLRYKQWELPGRIIACSKCRTLRGSKFFFLLNRGIFWHQK